MVKDIPADVAYIGGIWTEGVLYGIHIIVYFTLCYIFTSRAYTRGRETSSRVLLTYSTIMFALSTTHAGLGVRELLDGFVYALSSTPGGPPVYYRENVFPKRKAIYIFNTLLGDSLLVWRVFVIYGRSWAVTAPSILLLIGTTITGLKTVAANVMSEHSSVFDPSILSWVTSTFVLTIATQLLATTLIAYRIYAASRPFSYVPPDGALQVQQNEEDDETAANPNPNGNINGGGNSGSDASRTKGSKTKKSSARTRTNRVEITGGEVDKAQRAKYLSMVWLVVESGSVYTSAALVQLVTYLLNMNAGVIMEFMLAQLSAIIPMIIVVRVGLGLAYDGPSAYRPGYVPYTHPSNRPGAAAPGKRAYATPDSRVYQLSTFHAAERELDPEKTTGTIGGGSEGGLGGGMGRRGGMGGGESFGVDSGHTTVANLNASRRDLDGEKGGILSVERGAEAV